MASLNELLDEEVDTEASKPESSDPDDIVISDSDDSDDDSDDESVNPLPSPTRREKKGLRFKAMKDAAHKAEIDAAEARAEARLLREQLQSRSQAPAAPATSGPDPYDAAIAEVTQRKEMVLKNYHRISGTAKTQEEADRLHADSFRQVEALDVHRQQLIAERAAKKAAGDQQSAIRAAGVREIEANNQDVFGDAKKANVFRATYALEVAKGAPDTFETVQRVLQSFRGGETKAKSVVKGGDKAKFSAASSNSGASAPSEKGSPVVMTKAYRQMALAAFPKEKTDEHAYRRWVKEVYRKADKDD